MSDRAAHAAHDRNMTIDPREADEMRYEQARVRARDHDELPEYMAEALTEGLYEKAGVLTADASAMLADLVPDASPDRRADAVATFEGMVATAYATSLDALARRLMQENEV